MRGAPKGNTFAVGNSGGGRKSAYEERQDAAWHEEVWKSAQDIEVLEKKIESKVYAGRDIAALNLLKGDKYLIGKFMDKLVPDLHDHTSKGQRIFALPSELFEKNDISSYTEPSGEGQSYGIA